MKKNNKKFGFTLAEVLVTLGIVGLLATMVLPSLKDNYEERVLESGIKATYNSIQQAIAYSNNSGNRYLGGSAEEFYNRYLRGNIKILKYCGSSTGCWYKKAKGFKDLKSIPDNTFGDPITLTLYNGANLLIGSKPLTELGTYGVDFPGRTAADLSSQNGIMLVIDSNGDEDPNTLGYDQFITIWNGRELVPAGIQSAPDVVSQNCSLNGISGVANDSTGAFCLQYMIDNGWKIKPELLD